MKLPTKFLTCLIMLCSTITFGQDFQGQAHYFSKTSIDMSNFGGRQMSEDRRKQMEERMKTMFEKSYKLTFNKTESIYKEEEALAAPGSGGGGRFSMMMGSFTAGPQYKNVKENELRQQQEFFGKQFLIKDELPKLEWKLENETKQIGQYLCMKATAVKQLSDTDFTSFRRRGRGRDNNEQSKDSTKTDNEEEFEIPKETIVTAWYTPQIPVNQGPGEYWGLPGLILEVNVDRTTILCTKIVLNPKNKTDIKKPEKGKEVTRQEYNDIVIKKTEEMRNMRGRGGRGRGGRGGRN